MPEDITDFKLNIQRAHTGVVIAAAGLGNRLGLSTPKALVELRGEPMLVWSLRCFLGLLPRACYAIAAVAGAELEFEQLLRRHNALPEQLHIVAGGDTRQQSVWNALQQLPENTKYVLIHDAARPLVTPELINDVLAAAQRSTAATLAVRSVDTMVKGSGSEVKEVLDRSRLWQVQTPQAFSYDKIMAAHRRAAAEPMQLGAATDDAQLLLRLGEKVQLVEGSYDNIKVTTETDLKIAESLLTGHV